MPVHIENLPLQEPVGGKQIPLSDTAQNVEKPVAETQVLSGRQRRIATTATPTTRVTRGQKRRLESTADPAAANVQGSRHVYLLFVVDDQLK